MNETLTKDMAYEIFKWREEHAMKGDKESDWNMAMKYLKYYAKFMSIEQFMTANYGMIVKIEKTRERVYG